MDRDKNNQASTEQEQESVVLLSPFQLTDVRLKKIAAEVCKPDSERKAPDLVTQIVLIESTEPNPEEFDVELRFEVRRMKANGEGLDLAVILSGHFVAIVAPQTIPQETVRQFKNREVGLILWPYLRETVHDITGRMGLPLPPLPVVNTNEVFSATDVPEQENAG
jgi:preprotein translocase subunit SecB